MRQSKQCRRHAGFSMVELMVVVGIMVILAGLLVAALPGIQSRISRNKVETFIAELENGLEGYKIDNGIYPIVEDGGGDRNSRGVDGSELLYKTLSGDRNLDGAVDFAENEKVYVPKLDYDSNRSSKEPRSTVAGNSYLIVDSYGDPVRYIADPPNIERDERTTRNPTYDIWSLGGADPDDKEGEASYIANFQGR